MRNKRKLKLKKYYFHPITVYLILTFLLLILSAILSGLQMQATYNTISPTTNELENTLVTVENMLNFDGMKYIFSNAMTNFLSFAPLGMLLLTLFGLSIAKSTGFLDTLCKRCLIKIDNKILTFIVIFLATISSLINDVGYVILIPISAMLFLLNNRNPHLGIIAAFAGVSFGYGVSIFVGSMEVNLIPDTTTAARLIDASAHISLTSNLFIIIAFSLILSIVGTIIIEKIIAPRLGKYKEKEELSKTEELVVIDEIDAKELEQQKIEKERREKRGLKAAIITGIVVVILFIYSIIPNLPYSGMLLDMEEDTYLGQLFGPNSYFQDGFTYMMALLLTLVGIAYGIGAKTIKNDKDIINGCKETFAPMGEILMLIFVVAQFTSVFRETNIGTVIAYWCANAIGNIGFTGLPLIIFAIIMIGLANLFVPTPSAKWQIFAPVMVPAFMQSNLSAQFAQFILRAGTSITAGITPLLACFAIYIGYLNIYNQDKSKPITIHKSIGYVLPYFVIIAATWILLIIGWYLIGLPLGPGVYATI